MTNVMSSPCQTGVKTKKQKGFTLIELMVVVVIIGALMLIVMRAVGGNADNATAKALQSSATELAKGAGYLHVALGNGISNLSSTNPIVDTGDVLHVLMVGETAVVDAYKDRFNQLNMRSLETQFNRDTPTSTAWSLQNYPVKLFGSTEAACPGGAAGRGKVCVTFDSVATEVAQVLAEQLGVVAGATDIPASNDKGPFRWDNGGNNQKDIAFILTP